MQEKRLQRFKQEKIDHQIATILFNYGPISTHETESGRKITILPTCSLPETHLIEENWDPTERKINQGNFRRVRSIKSLVNNERTSLYVKGPERLLTASLERLRKGCVWWGGPRSGERYVYFPNGIIEEQAEWEAAYLLELHKHGIRAELPQAVVESPDGQKEVVVRKIERYGWFQRKPLPQQTPKERICPHIREATGLIPVDCGDHNRILDHAGYWTIIDVNRWEWPPHTNNFKEKLVEIIRRNMH